MFHALVMGRHSSSLSLKVSGRRIWSMVKGPSHASDNLFVAQDPPEHLVPNLKGPFSDIAIVVVSHGLLVPSGVE
jgi:hypothetical protein